MASRLPFLVRGLTILAFIAWPVSVGAQPAPDSAKTLLDQMSPESRIGQLFLVTFHGTTFNDESPITQLIRDYHIGGVVLQAENDNFTDAPDTAQGLHDLVKALQTLNAVPTGEPAGLNTGNDAGETGRAVYVPLYVGLSDPANSVPLSTLISGMSPLPSEMAIGATWDPTLAAAAGSMLGKELEALGINLFLGPSLDVLEDPGLGSPGDLGVATFGGDPYWVSEMGSAYIDGLHLGSNDRITVISKHFPGHGGSDRPLQEEVATVRKSLDQLMQIELPPFFAVTQGDPGSDGSITDGLLTSHIRYQGFQGNIRATTRPISLDPEAFAQLMSLDPLKSWRAGGGLTMSDSLGSRAIRRFRDPSERTFPAHLVARDALVAGNDLLYLSSFRDPADPDELTTIKATLDFFTQKYQEDQVFAQRVDEAVLRILGAKLRLYDDVFSLDHVLPADGEMAGVGSQTEVALNVVRAGATLISPSVDLIEDRVGGPPQLGQRIVFFTDVRLTQRCSTCKAEPIMDERALENRILSLYGPGAAGQVGNWNIESFTMADLDAYLGNSPSKPPPVPLVAPEAVDEALRTADWLVFSVLGMNDDVYGADALKVLLESRSDLARSKRMVVFAFDVPYGLDATNMSKVDLYYGLYSPLTSFVDLAARLLFQEVSAPGASPVSVTGVGYDLIDALKPDPTQVIDLSIKGEVGVNTPTPEPAGFEQGNLVTLETGAIVDVNHHAVPDHTPVEFILSYQGENLAQTVEAETVNGIAETTFRLDRLGLLTIQARSEPALLSNVLKLNVQEGVAAFPTVIAPTPVPSDTPAPTETLGPATPTVAAGGASTPSGSQSESAAGWRQFLAGVVGALLSGLAGYGIAFAGVPFPSTRLRVGLLAAAGALVMYNYCAMGLPGAGWLVGAGSFSGGLAASIAGGVLAVGGYWGWGRLSLRRLADRG